MAFHPKGRRVLYRHAFTTTSGIEVRSGALPLLVVYVKATSRAKKDFAYRCRTHGVIVTRDGSPVWEGELERESGQRDEVSAYEVTGAPDALELLTGCAFVVEWHFVMDAKPPRGATGSGPEKTPTPPPVWKERLLADPRYSRDDDVLTK